MNIKTIALTLAILSSIVAYYYGYPTTLWASQPGKQEIICPGSLIEGSTSYVTLVNKGKISSIISVEFNTSNEGILFRDDYRNINNNASRKFYTSPGEFSQFIFIPVVNKSQRGNTTLYITALSYFNFGPLYFKTRNYQLYKECNYSKSASNSFRLESENS